MGKKGDGGGLRGVEGWEAADKMEYMKEKIILKRGRKNKSFAFLSNSEMQGNHFVRGCVLEEQEFKGKITVSFEV